MIKSTSFSIDVDIMNKFKDICKKNAINQSAFITIKIKEFIDEYEAKEDKK